MRVEPLPSAVAVSPAQMSDGTVRQYLVSFLLNDRVVIDA
jgi:hypothetical protein